MNNTDQFTAWITTDHSCLNGDLADVVVLRDEISGYREDAEGNETPEWTSTSDEQFSAVTGIRHDGDHNQIIAQAEELLAEAGWDTGKWETVPTGYIAVVEHTA